MENTIQNGGVIMFGEYGLLFTARSPKPDSIKAVKLTEGNVRDVAAHILKAIGGKVKVEDDRLSVHEGDFLHLSARVDQWIVEKYDYWFERVRFSTATTREREKYDLR